MNTKACFDNANGPFLDDTGYVCLALNGSNACQLPITLTPAVLTFSPQLLVACAKSGGTSDCSEVSRVPRPHKRSR